MTAEPPPSSHPFDRLTPDLVLDALDTVGLRGDGRLLQLNSFENRVFQVWLEDGRRVVAKFYRPDRWTDAQIQEEHDFARELAEAEIPVVAPLVLPDGGTLGRHAGFRFSASPYRGGREPDLEDPHALEWIGRFLGRLHAIGRRRPFSHRPSLDWRSFGTGPRDWLLAHDLVPSEARTVWQEAAQRALDLAIACFDATGPYTPVRLHGDVHRGNLLWTDAGPHFVDLDDARTGPPMQDLWMLLSGNVNGMRMQLSHVCRGYEDFCDLDPRQWRLVEALRTLRLLHHSAWLASRWEDPAFPAAFPWFGTPTYWIEQAVRLREQCEAMQDWQASL